jgi:hypothetical protein
VFSAAAIALAGLSLGSMQAARAADLTQYISPDFCAVLVIHPDRIGESTLAEAVKSVLPKEAVNGDPTMALKAMAQNQKNLPPGFNAEKLAKLLKDVKVHRVVVAFDTNAEKPAAAGGGLIVQFASDVDGEAILSAVSTAWQDADIGGVKCKSMKSPDGADIAAVAPDSRMLIAGVKATVAKMLAKNEGERPLLKQLQKASLKHDILVEFYAEPMWAGLTKSSGKSIDQLAASAGNPDMAKDVKSVSLQLDFSGKTLLHGEVSSGKPETAATLAMMGQVGVNGGKQQFAALKRQPPPLLPPPLVPVLSKLGDEIFAGLAIKSDGPLLTVDLPMPDSLPDALKAGAKMIPGAMPAPGGP